MALTTADIRNLVLIGHAGSGKTLLAEALLHRAGATKAMGELARGTTVCDFDEEEHRRKLPTAEINRWLESVQRRRALPSTRLGKVARIYYATQTGTSPPELTLFVNAPSRVSEAYQRYLLLDLKATFGFPGTPVRLKLRKSE